MCYAIPGRVIDIQAKKVFLDYFGDTRTALNEFVELKIGDYVYAQGGFVVNKIPTDKALSILEGWKELFSELKEKDLELAIPKTSIPTKDRTFSEIIQKVRLGGQADKNEGQILISAKDKQELQVLYETANFVRQKHHGNACCVHGIIEFSNYCVNDCNFCGLTVDNKIIERYRMTIDEIVDIAEFSVNKLGFKALVLQSGEDPWFTTEKIVKIIKKIRERCATLIFLSVGERTEEDFRDFYDAGVRGVLLRFETSNPAIYKNIRTRLKFEDRVRALKILNKLGFLVVTGGLIGLPGQTDADLIDDILMAKENLAEMYSFGPFIPHPDTKLAKHPKADTEKVLKFIAVARFMDPDAKILVTTAMMTLDPINGARSAMMAGANSIMLNLTPAHYKKLYSIYPDKALVKDCIAEQINSVIDLLQSLGRAPTDLGIS